MQNIVIVGAGFGGIRTALELDKKFRNNKKVQITLVDKHSYQLFHPSLYEVATAEEDLTETANLKRSITVPLADIFKNTRIKLVTGEVLVIDPNKKQISLKKEKLQFNYLVLALGSTTDYLNIRGAEEHSLPLKSLSDALRVRNAVEVTIQSHRTDTSKKSLRIIIAGGGYTGVEFAAELGNELKIIAWKNNYPLHKIEVDILEASDTLIPGLDHRLSKDALIRLKELGIRVQLSTLITRVEDGFLTLNNGEREAFDLLIWTTGVKAKSIPISTPEPKDTKERLSTKMCLQLLNHNNIFALGDCACIFNSQGRPVPSTAQNAIHQARYISYAVKETMAGRTPTPYQAQQHGFIVTMGGKWAILKWNNWYIKGFLGYLFRIAADFRYFYSIVGFWMALKIIILQTDLYSRND